MQVHHYADCVVTQGHQSSNILSERLATDTAFGKEPEKKTRAAASPRRTVLPKFRSGRAFWFVDKLNVPRGYVIDRDMCPGHACQNYD